MTAQATTSSAAATATPAAQPAPVVQQTVLPSPLPDADRVNALNLLQQAVKLNPPEEVLKRISAAIVCLA